MSRNGGSHSSFLVWMFAACICFWVLVCAYVPGISDVARALWNSFRAIANF